ncbi:hypothetical protein D8682_19210 [Buttiauxella sp. 3AFRM03]|jgi:hypothetical protein|nr:hypothetical protein D8682_19210 [Buttiauxella sp. 3AFRM03]
MCCAVEKCDAPQIIDVDISATFINTLVIFTKALDCQVKSTGSGKLRLYDENLTVYGSDSVVLARNSTDMDKLFL